MCFKSRTDEATRDEWARARERAQSEHSDTIGRQAVRTRPRGNQEPDELDLERAIDKLNRVLTH